MDGLAVAGIVVAIFAIDQLSHRLVPPDGPLFFHHSPIEFPFQWMVDLCHIITFSGFILRAASRIWRT